MAKPRGLTSKQQEFVRQYLIDLNGAAAYRRAGYKAKNDHVAAASANKLLTNTDIAEAIREAQAKRSKRTEITADWVIKKLRKEILLKGDGGPNSARVAALKLLGQHLGMFTEKVKLEGSEDNPIRHKHEHSLDADDVRAGREFLALAGIGVPADSGPQPVDTRETAPKAATVPPAR